MKYRIVFIDKYMKLYWGGYWWGFTHEVQHALVYDTESQANRSAWIAGMMVPLYVSGGHVKLEEVAA